MKKSVAGRRSIRFFNDILNLPFLLPVVFGHGASAQSNVQLPSPPETRVVSPWGVDLRSGLYAYAATDLSIGDEKSGGIFLKRGPSTGPRHSPFATPYPDAFAQFSNNWDTHITWTNNPKNMHTVSVTALGLSYNFTTNTDFSNPTLISQAGYATLQMTGTASALAFRITIPSGMTVDFVGSTVTITRPDGIVYLLSYNGSSIGAAPMLQSVVSNVGLAILFQYSAGRPWPLIGRACVINLTTMPLPSTCPNGVHTTSYTYSNTQMTQMTDVVNATWTFNSFTRNSSGDYTDQFFIPGASAPYLSIDYSLANGPEEVSEQRFADGRVIDYTWNGETYGCPYGSSDCNDQTFPLGSGYTENGANHTSIAFYVGPYSSGAPPVVSSGPTQVTDALNRTYTTQYCKPGSCALMGLPIITTTPEGIQSTYSYDSCRNITKRLTSPKAGSGLATSTVSATFGNCGATTIAQDSPTAVVDANGNETDYSYSPVHGGVLTETLPAGSDGIRPVKRYAYTQRYAWISNGSGGYVHAGGPIWLKTEERTCRTTATSGNACAGGSADEVVTAYDYGPDSGPNNLWLRGIAVTADSQTRRTCYGYDTYGRRIWETKARAGLASCS